MRHRWQAVLSGIELLQLDLQLDLQLELQLQQGHRSK